MPKLSNREVEMLCQYAVRTYRDGVKNRQEELNKKNAKLISSLRKKYSELYKELNNLSRKLDILKGDSWVTNLNKEEELKYDVRMQLMFADDVESVKKGITSIVSKYILERNKDA